ncbi:hypothetical protein F4806DRAFT_87414 [Annulohypoxylon nitens]|nr:hypothetical protein F4806DRAFT_87414 [Annulohypoxylon nitens]
MISSHSQSQGIARSLLVAVVFAFGIGFITAIYFNTNFMNIKYERRSPFVEERSLPKKLVVQDVRTQQFRGKRGAITGITAETFSSGIQNQVIDSLRTVKSEMRNDLTSAMSMANSSRISLSESPSILLTDQPILSFSAPLETNGTKSTPLVERTGSLHARYISQSTPGIVQATTSASLNWDLGDISGLAQARTSFASKKVEGDLCSTTTVVNGTLTTIIGMCDGTASFVADNGPMTDASETTLFPFPSSTPVVVTTSPNVTPFTTSSSDTCTTTPATEGPPSSGSGITASREDCPSITTETVFIAGETSTTTVYASKPCPTVPPCTTCESPTCHCPNAGAPTTPEGNGAQGPCPGSGYTCYDCLDGWFCPPPQTPAQSAPCGFGWPCAHCDGGWFCVPGPTSSPSSETCTTSSGPTTNSASTTSSTRSTTSSRPNPTHPTGTSGAKPNPKSPRAASGWGYCGCWADQPDKPAFSLGPHTNIGPLTNAACVQHCMTRGYLMAGTEGGDSCYCGNFLNGTQHLDDSACSTPCAGDPKEACGGSRALTCYSSDNEAHGWASVGPQPLPATVSPPEIISLAAGGIAHSVVTQTAAMFPPPGADLSSLVNHYGHKTKQPEGQLPSGLGGPAPGSQATSPNGGDGGAAPVQGGPSSSNPNGAGGAAPVSQGGNPTSPGGNSNSGTNPSSAPTGGAGAAPVSGANSNTSPNQDSSSSSPGGGMGGAAPVTAGGNPTSPASSPAGIGGAGASPTSPSTNTGKIPPCDGSNPNCTPVDGDQTSGQGQGTAAPNPTGNPTQYPSGQGTAAPNGIPSTCTAGSTDPKCNPSSQNQGPNSPSNAGTAAPNPTGHGSRVCSIGSNDPSCTDMKGHGGSPTSTSPGQGQGTAAPNANPNQSTCTSGSNDPACSSPENGGTAAPGATQGSTSPNGNGSAAPNPLTPSNSPSSSSPNNGAGGPAPGQNQPTTSGSNGIPSTCTAESTDPTCTSPNNGGAGAAPGQSQPTTFGPNDGSLSGSSCTPGSNDPNCTPPGSNGGNPNPSGTGGQAPVTNDPTTTNPSSNGGGASPVGQGNGSGTPSTPGSNPNSSPSGNGGAGPNNGGNGSGSPSTPGSKPTPDPTGASGAAPGQGSNPTSPPGAVPYSARPSPSMTTFESMIAWTEPDGSIGSPTTMLHNGLSSDTNVFEVPELDFEKAPTSTISTSMLTDPRWRLVRPVAMW